MKAGLIQITITCSPSLAENGSRLFKNSEGNCDGEQIFCQRKEADVDKNKKDQKNLRSKLN